MKKIIYLCLSVLAVVLLLFYMLGIIGTTKTAPGASALPAQVIDDKLPTAVVQRQTIEDILSWPGTVKSRTEAHIAPRVTARILEIKVNAGDRVKKGDIIAQLDPKAQRSQERAARAALVAAKADAQRALADAKRIKNLYAKEAVTRANYDQVIAQSKVAQARVDAANSTLKEAGIGYDDTILKAPFDGVVVQRLKQPGDMGLAGAPIVILHNSAALRLEAAVPVSCARFIQLGDKIPVRIENIAQDMIAEVDEIVPEVDPKTRTILIKAALPVIDKLQPGLFGWLDQACSQHEGLLIPAKAVHKIGQLEIVKLVLGDRLQTRQVRSGKRYGDNIEIQSGLKAGETIVSQ